jgi:hypothetical protein
VDLRGVITLDFSDSEHSLTSGSPLRDFFGDSTSGATGLVKEEPSPCFDNERRIDALNTARRNGLPPTGVLRRDWISDFLAGTLGVASAEKKKGQALEILLLH